MKRKLNLLFRKRKLRHLEKATDKPFNAEDSLAIDREVEKIEELES